MNTQIKQQRTKIFIYTYITTIIQTLILCIPLSTLLPLVIRTPSLFLFLSQHDTAIGNELWMISNRIHSETRKEICRANRSLYDAYFLRYTVHIAPPVSLSLFLCLCLSFSLIICLSVCISVCDCLCVCPVLSWPSVFLCVWLFLCQSVSLFVRHSVRLFICVDFVPSVTLCFVCLSQSVWLSVSVSLSVCTRSANLSNWNTSKTVQVEGFFFSLHGNSQLSGEPPTELSLCYNRKSSPSGRKCFANLDVPVELYKHRILYPKFANSPTTEKHLQANLQIVHFDPFVRGWRTAICYRFDSFSWIWWLKRRDG